MPLKFLEKFSDMFKDRRIDVAERFELLREAISGTMSSFYMARDRKSGKNLFFRVQKVDWRKDGEVWVRGGYYEGNLSSSIELFQVVNENGKWVVKGARMEAIS